MTVTTAEAQRVGDYLLTRRIAAGACGEVWLGRHCNGTGDPIAVKVNNDPQYLRNLQKDWDALHGLRHPGIVQAIDFDPYADPPYLAMEYVPGSSLRPLIQERKLGVAEAVAVLRHVLAALAHAHGMGIVHRDIKPENILLHERAFRDGFSSEGVVKVTDFGLGRIEQLTSNSIELSTSLSGEDAQHVVGTLAYMAPEQQEGLPADARADLYACGIVFFEMLTGRKPHGAVLPSKLNSSVPKHLDKAFQRAFGWLDERYASAEEFIDALSEPTAPPGILPAPPIALAAPLPDWASGPTPVAGIAGANKLLSDSRGKSDSPVVLAVLAFLASCGCCFFLLLVNATNIPWHSIFDPQAVPAFVRELSQESTRISLLGILLAVYASLPRRPAACRGAALVALLVNVGMLVATASTESIATAPPVSSSGGDPAQAVHLRPPYEVPDKLPPHANLTFVEVDNGAAVYKAIFDREFDSARAQLAFDINTVKIGFQGDLLYLKPGRLSEIYYSDQDMIQAEAIIQSQRIADENFRSTWQVAPR